MADFWDTPEPGWVTPTDPGGGSPAGGWGTPILGADPYATDLSNGPQVQAKDVLTQTTVSKGQDQWSGWFQNLVGGVAGYAVAKDAKKNGVPMRAPNGQLIYPGQPAPMNSTLLILGGLALVAVVVLAKGQ